MKDFESDPNVAGGNIENRIGRIGHIKRSAHFLINAATLKEIRWKNPHLRKFKEATVVDSEVLIVGCVIQNSRIWNRGISELIPEEARVVPEVRAGKGHGFVGLVESE